VTLRPAAQQSTSSQGECAQFAVAVQSLSFWLVRVPPLPAAQVIINCGPAYGLGAGCDGGEVYDVFEYMHRYGLPDESCMNYVAQPTRPNHLDRCDPIDICMNVRKGGE